MSALLLALHVARPCFSSGIPSDDLRVRRLSVEDGLSQSAVTCIAQDSRGMLWFGTQDGLNRYDGYDFTVFKQLLGDTTSLADNCITALRVDRSGDLWVGTYSGGLHRLDPHGTAFARYQHREGSPEGPIRNSIMALASDSDGGIWAAAWNRGLSRLDPRSGARRHYSRQRDSTAIPDNRISSLAVDPEGNVWIGPWGGYLGLHSRR